MRPRPLWLARCPKAHVYSDVDGAPTSCPECGQEPATWITCPHDLENQPCDCAERIEYADGTGALLPRCYRGTETHPIREHVGSWVSPLLAGA
jgi:hypothetical protein